MIIKAKTKANFSARKLEFHLVTPFEKLCGEHRADG
jgi:hypothetical protein